MSIESLTLITTIVLGLSGYLITYFNDLRLAKRADELAHLQAQLDNFYGPLYITTKVGYESWLALFKAQGLEPGVFPTREAAEEELELWRIWVENVFMPQNEILDQIIKNGAHLLEEEQVPQCLLDFSTHVAGYRAIVARWKAGDYRDHLSIIPFPPELHEYAKSTYIRLKHRQLSLLGKK